MENQEQLRSIDQNPICHQMHGHVKTESSVHLPREINSSGDEYVTRVRKSYTLTKQRERWTEEEHKKFLEALQLYGRAWGQIEEHIGTKTAVQIRSHAQKFFSKVARESARTDGNGTVKSIHIPPPRPKRKPVHPYPQKLGNITNNGAPSLEELERTLQTPTTCEPDDRSPVSVLSSAGTETQTSTSSNGQNGCLSTVAPASGTNDQDDGGQSPTMTVQEDIELSSVCEAMKDQPSSQMTSSEAHIPTLKLFGKTVEVTESDNSSTHDAGNEPQHSRTTLSLGVDCQARINLSLTTATSAINRANLKFHPKSNSLPALTLTAFSRLGTNAARSFSSRVEPDTRANADVHWPDRRRLEACRQGKESPAPSALSRSSAPLLDTGIPRSEVEKGRLRRRPES